MTYQERSDTDAGWSSNFLSGLQTTPLVPTAFELNLLNTIRRDLVEDVTDPSSWQVISDDLFFPSEKLLVGGGNGNLSNDGRRRGRRVVANERGREGGGERE